MKITHKRGDDFICSMNMSDYDDRGKLIGPIDITNITIRCQARDKDTLIEEFTVEKTNPAAGDYRLVALRPRTLLWPIKMLDCDIEYTIDGLAKSTETFQINVAKDITRD